MKVISLATSKQSTVDYVNIGLMVISFILAIKLPFTLFLLSYAILGPLHYLTEIFWLDKHAYYVNDKKDTRWLIVLSILVTILIFIKPLPAFQQTVLLKDNFRNILSGLIFTAFIAAIAFTIFKSAIYKFLTILIALLLGLWLWKWPSYLILFGVLLTTVIHVCIFTAAFIFYGALRSKQFSGYLSFIFYVGCIIAFFIFPLAASSYNLSANQNSILHASGFTQLNQSLAQLLHIPAERSYNLLTENAIRIQCFIAFAYTYHYLNWFSKVDIIRWNKVPGNLWVITIITWIVAVALYFLNYKTGLMTLFLLSLLHVFLEFPLNIKTFIAIGKSIRKAF